MEQGESGVIPDDLYDEIRRVLPIACVDLIVQDDDERYLLLLRRNEPAAGQWWFPGGRVHHGERRIDAARRKLRSECGLEARTLVEQGTHDVLLPLGSDRISHGITTVFRVQVDGSHHLDVKLDGQSEQASWRTREDWAKEKLDDFVRAQLAGTTG